MIKTDANGNESWTQTFGGSSYDYGYSVQQTTDWGYIIAGGTYSYGAGYYDVYLIKTDVNGNESWTQTFGGSADDYSYSVQQTTDGGYIIAGGTYSYGADGGDVYLIKTDANGNEVWMQTFGGSAEDDVGSNVQQTADGGYIIAGYTSSYGAGSYDVYLIRLDAQGSSVESLNGDLSASFTLHPNYPNPFNASTTIPFTNNAFGKVNLTIYNNLGREVWSTAVGCQQSAVGKSSVVWNAEGMASGVYIIRLETPYKMQSIPVILVK